MFIKIGNYKDGFALMEVPDSTFLIDVMVVTGYEVAKVYYRDENKQIQSSVFNRRGLFDCEGSEMYFTDLEYYVDPEDEDQMLSWHRRTSVYNPFGELDADVSCVKVES